MEPACSPGTVTVGAGDLAPTVALPTLCPRTGEGLAAAAHTAATKPWLIAKNIRPAGAEGASRVALDRPVVASGIQPTYRACPRGCAVVEQPGSLARLCESSVRL